MDGDTPAEQFRAQDGDLRGGSHAVRIVAIHFDNGNQGKLPGTGISSTSRFARWIYQSVAAFPLIWAMKLTAALGWVHRHRRRLDQNFSDLP
jgi:hypothetical protein